MISSADGGTEASHLQLNSLDEMSFSCHDAFDLFRHQIDIMMIWCPNWTGGISARK
jgi:hypothetical protein